MWNLPVQVLFWRLLLQFSLPLSFIGKFFSGFQLLSEIIYDKCTKKSMKMILSDVFRGIGHMPTSDSCMSGHLPSDSIVLGHLSWQNNLLSEILKLPTLQVQIQMLVVSLPMKTTAFEASSAGYLSTQVTRKIGITEKWPLMQESEVGIWPIPRKTSDKTIFYRFSWISLIFVKQLKATDWHIVISQWNILNCREKFTDKRYREIVIKRQEYARQNIRQENTCIGKLTSTVTLTSRGRVWSVWTNIDVTRLHGVNFCQSRVV